MPCPRCGYENPSNARFCARCNFVLQADASAYNPDDQMKVVLPPVIRPLQPVFKTHHAAIPPNQPAANSAPLSPPDTHPAKRPAVAGEVAQTVVLDPKAVAAITQGRKPAPVSAQKPKTEPELAKATHFSMAIGTASVVLLAVAVAYYLLQLRRDKATEMPLPAVVISAPVVTAEASPPAPSAIAASEPVAIAASEALSAAPVQSAPSAIIEPTPVIASTSAVVEPTTSAPSAQSGPRILPPRDVVALLRVLKKRNAPKDCAAANAMLVDDYAVAPRQAVRIAKLAYPEQCLPPKPALEPAPTRASPAPERPNSAATASPPVTPRPKARTIDDLYEERIGNECSRGAFGHICRESIRLTLCSGKLSDNPPPGQTVCTQ